jgi:hypothetical protein
MDILPWLRFPAWIRWRNRSLHVDAERDLRKSQRLRKAAERHDAKASLPLI